MMRKPQILGISASLRNSRYGAGSRAVIEELASLSTKQQLLNYLETQAKLRAEDFFNSGRKDGLAFDEIYKNLQKLDGQRGLSNSEVGLLAALWGAMQHGADIMHLGLSQHFPDTGEYRAMDLLREKVLSADAILLSGPVYFGDRGSLAQEFIEFLAKDPACRQHIKNKLYAGVSVGAKRNGGQETTLIYQLFDMCNLGMLAVGNDSSTTSQYGGILHAGDVGTARNDEYGIDTAIGTGKRMARVAKLFQTGSQLSTSSPVNVGVWLLQDNATKHGFHQIKELCSDIENASSQPITFSIYDFTEEKIRRCIACDICPTHVGPKDEYRCIIQNRDDVFKKYHQEITNTDAILLAAYSSHDKNNLKSVYQRFIERTRYLRRDNYIFSDMLASALVISEMNAMQNLHRRMLTSLVRHHTVINQPLIGFEHESQLLNRQQLVDSGCQFAKLAKQLHLGRIAMAEETIANTFYNPVGYTISAEKLKEKHVAEANRQEQLNRAKNFVPSEI